MSSDAISLSNSAESTWGPLRAFLTDEWRPFAQMLGAMSRSWQGSPAAWNDFLVSQNPRARALIQKGIRLGLPFVPVASSVPMATPSRSSSSGVPMSSSSSSSSSPFLGRAACGGELARMGAIASPSPVSITLDVGADRVLRASICLDGTCYQGQADLGPLLDNLAMHVRAYHDDHLHAGHPVAAVAGCAIMGDLVDRHALTMSAGWWSSLKKTAKSTLKKLKGPIAAAAGIAAGAAVTAIPGGVAIAPLAGNLAHSLVESAAGTGSAKDAAAAFVAQAQTVAKSDPKVAHALDQAHKAVAQATATYHIAETVSNAADGSSEAAGKLLTLATAADAGDPDAKTALDIAQSVASAQGAAGGAGATTVASGVSGAPVMLGLHPLFTQSKARARNYVQNRAASGKRGVVGYVHLMTGQRYVIPFRNQDAADDWFGMIEPGTFIYAAYFDPSDATFPGALNEKFWEPVGQVARASDRFTHDPATVSGMIGGTYAGHWLLPMGVGAGLTFAMQHAWRWYQQRHPKEAAAVAPAPTPAPAAPVTASGARDPIFVDVPVCDEDGNPTGDAVSWPTSQNAKHGGRAPDLWVAPELDSHGGNVFLWMPRTWPIEDGNAQRQWKPTWRVTRHPMPIPTASPTTASGFPLLPFALGAGLGAGTIYAHRWLEAHRPRSNAPESAGSPMAGMAQGAGAGVVA